MGRDVGASCRVCRRERMKLFLKGVRCRMAKCPIERGRPPPGMHGQRRGRKTTDYGLQLRAKQTLRRQYGVREEQFRAMFRRAQRAKGMTGERLLQMLESRLDNLVYRMGFALSRAAARQLVLHGHVTVNGKRATIPSMQIGPGSVIVIRDAPRSRALASRALDVGEGRPVPPWLSVDARNFSGEYLRLPTRSEIAPLVDEQLVVELYSK